MKKNIILVSLMFFSLGVYAQELTQVEKDYIAACENNVDKTKKIYDPQKAQECIQFLDAGDMAVLSKLRKNDEYRALDLLAKLNALYDISDLYDKTDNVYYIRTGLVVMLEKANPCVLCEMEVGKEPEKVFWWVEKYKKDKLDYTKRAVIAWEKLSAELKTVFAEYSLTKEKWEAMPITKRETILPLIVEDKYSKIMPKEGDKFDPKNLDAAKAISPFLSKEKKDALKKAIEGMASSVSSSTGSVSAASVKAAGELKEQLSQNPADSFMLLGRAFDNSSFSGLARETPAAGDAVVKKASLTDDEAKKISPFLQTALFKEVGDTPIGKDAIAFSKTPAGKLNFAVEDLKSESTRGMFRPSKGEVRINKSYVEAAMTKLGISKEDLLNNDPAAMAAIARYVSPTFIHEYEGHQKQFAWAKANGIPGHYYIGMETEAFSKGYLLVLQKQKIEKENGNENYNTQIDESNLKMAKALKDEGYKGIEKRILYYEVQSFNGKASTNYATYEIVLRELAERKLAAEKDPKAEAELDKTRPNGYKTADLIKFRDTFVPYTWYSKVSQKTLEEKAYFEQRLKDLE